MLKAGVASFYLAGSRKPVWMTTHKLNKICSFDVNENIMRGKEMKMLT